ncbi:MAG: DUF433 domain-containing protein [Alphaproteobacteria bacterium]
MARKTFGRIFTSDTIENGAPVLNRIFSTAVSPDLLRDSPAERLKYIKVQDILDLLDAGFRESDVLSGYTMLDESDITACRAFAAVNMPQSQDYRRNNRYKGVKILLDENVYHGLILPLSHHISNLSHIYYEGMGGFTDEYIYWRPHYFLKDESAKERRRKRGMRHIIISNDSDLCDLAEGQWRQRIATSSDPDAIDFSDTNTVFSIEKRQYKLLLDPEFCEKISRSIMRAAYNPKAPWYKIRDNGSVYPGKLFSSLCTDVEEAIRSQRFQQGKEEREERLVLRSQRLSRNLARRGIVMPNAETPQSLAPL